MADLRRNAIIQGSPAGEDASALREININSSNPTRRVAISNLYKTLPDHSMKNSDCGLFDLIRPSTGNDPISRFKSWKDEEYFITEVSTWYKIINVLNVVLLICIMVFSYRLWSNNCEVVIVPKDETVSQSSIDNLKKYNTVVNDWLNPAISALVFVYTSYRVFKRTTNACRKKIAIENTYRVEE